MDSSGKAQEGRGKLRRESFSLQEVFRHEKEAELYRLVNEATSHSQAFKLATLSIINGLWVKMKSRV